MLKRNDEKALEEKAARAGELVASGDDNGAVVWRRITAVVAQLACMTPARTGALIAIDQVEAHT